MPTAEEKKISAVIKVVQNKYTYLIKIKTLIKICFNQQSLAGLVLA